MGVAPVLERTQPLRCNRGLNMSDIGTPQVDNALVARVKAILMSPKTEWPIIEAEASKISEIYKSQVMPLAAIGPVASLIGSLTFGVGAFGITYHPSILSAVSTALVSYVLTLVMVFVFALVINALAPQFGAVKNQTAAFKVAAYGGTAGWVAGIFGILPALSLLAVLGGLYSLYLIYLGLPVLMKAPQDKAGAYTAVVVVAMIVAALVIGLVTAPAVALFGGGALIGGPTTVSGSLNIPGAGSVDMSKLGKASKAMEAVADRAKNGQTTTVIAPDVLASILPTTLNGLPRTSIESQSAGAAGIGGSNAEAHYGAGDNEIKLSITDMGAMGGLASLGGALDDQSSKQDATRYERVGKVDGRMTTEKYDNATKIGSYGTLVGDRVMVEAEGKAASGAMFKAAVAAIDLARVESLTTH